MRQFWEFILNFLAEIAGKKSHPFQQAFNIRIRIFFGQEAGQMGFFRCQQLAKLAQVIEFFPKIAFFKFHLSVHPVMLAAIRCHIKFKHLMRFVKCHPGCNMKRHIQRAGGG